MGKPSQSDWRIATPLLALWFITQPAQAQEQHATLQGVVADQSGAPVPGASVEARSQAGSVISQSTSATGTYRFATVAPGKWDLTATFAGFNPARVPGVALSLGQELRVNLTLTVAMVSEAVTVTGEAPLIDVKGSARATSLRDEAIELLPKGRDFTSLVTQISGANGEPKMAGLAIDGASSGEHRYVVDGIETTDLWGGVSGKDVITDFVEEVQVKSSGYSAEFGAATGGVISVLTRSGTNDLHGEIGGYFSGNALGYPCGSESADFGAEYCDGRKTLRVNPTDSSVAEYVVYPEDTIRRFEPGLSLGGPIVRDRLWFFAGYQPRLLDQERTWTSTVDGQTRTNVTKERQHFLVASVTGQPSAETRFRVAYNGAHDRSEGVLPGLDGSTHPEANLAIDAISPNWSLSGNVDYMPTKNLIVSLRGGVFASDGRNEGVYQGDRYVFGNSNIGLAGVPPELQRPGGTQNQRSIYEVTRFLGRRGQAQLDTTVLFSGAGRHELKLGVGFDRRSTDVLAGDTANTYMFNWNRALGGERGAFGYYTVRSNRVIPERGALSSGKAATDTWQLFAQDAWTIGSQLTLNLGVRTEDEVSPSYADPFYGLPSEVIHFGFGDKLTPRAGFAYDVKGDGKWKLYGSWGLFYDVLKLGLPLMAFGGQKRVDYYYTLDTPDWPSLIDLPGCPPACPGRQLLAYDMRPPSNETVRPGIKPMRSQEFVLGGEHALSPTLSVGLRYVHKQLDRALEDIGGHDAEGNAASYVIGNPGEGPDAVYVVPDTGQQITLPKAQRDYDAVELTLNRRLANRWSVRASYLWSRLHGNYTGLTNSDWWLQVYPNLTRTFDDPFMSFDQDGQPVFGPLSIDRTHQGKVQALYDSSWGASVGANLYLASGTPLTRKAYFLPGSWAYVQYLGRGSDGRTPFYSQLDLYAQYAVRLGGKDSSKRLTFSANVLNVLGAETVTNVHTDELDDVITISDAQFFAGFDTQALIAEQGLYRDPRFLMDLAFQAPREIRLGVKLSF